MSITKVNKDIIAINSHMMDNNTYIIINNDKAIIIDPSFSGEELLAYFNQNKAIKPIAIILTHAHFDHCFDTAKFLVVYNIPVYIHKLDRITYEKYDCTDLAGITLPRFDQNVKYFDQNKLNIEGIELEVILTPGHTSGSITILYKNNAFVGDTLFYISYGRTDLANSSQKDIVKSIKTLYKVLKDDTHVFCGHGQDGTLKEIKEVNTMANELVK